MTKRIGTEKERKAFLIPGVVKPLELSVYNLSINALERAVKERIFFVKNDQGEFVVPHRPTTTFVNSALASFKRKLVPNLLQPTPYTHIEYALSYVGRKRVLYLDAANSLLHTPYNKRDAMLTAFVKHEKINFTSKPDAVPRVIQPRDPRYHVSLGRYVKRIEKQIYKSVNNVFGAPTILKSLNQAERGAVLKSHWDYFDDPVAIGLDAHRFDQHVSTAMLRWEHGVYKACFPADSELTMLLNAQLLNKGSGHAPDGSLKYTVEGCRMSGDVNTSLGNCLIMCAMMFSYFEQIGVAKYRLANDGDDCVVFIERTNLDTFLEGVDEYFGSLGFSMATETAVSVLEHVEFCQSRPIYLDGSYVMVRNIDTALNKDATSLVHITSKRAYRRWCAAIGQCGLSQTGGIPVYQDFYTSFIRASEGATPFAKHVIGLGYRDLSDGMNQRYREPSVETRLSFYKAFGWSANDQEHIARLLADKLVVYQAGTGESTRHVDVYLPCSSN